MVLKLKIGDKLKLSAQGVKAWHEAYSYVNPEVFRKRVYLMDGFSVTKNWPYLIVAHKEPGDTLTLSVGTGTTIMPAEQSLYEILNPPLRGHPLTKIFK